MLDNRKKYLIVITIITILCIIGGTIYHSWRVTKEIKQEIGSSADYSDSVKDSFSSIHMDVSLMEIIIEEGNDFLYEVSYNNEDIKPKAYIDGNTLKVKQTKKKILLPTFRPKCYVNITVPKGTILDEIKIESHVGEIKIDNIEAKTIKVESNVDDITVSNCVSGSIKVENNVGEIRFINCDASTVEGTTNVGEVHVDAFGDINDYTLEVSTSVGDVNINGIKTKKSYTQKGQTDKKIILNTNVGEIHVQ